MNTTRTAHVAANIRAELGRRNISVLALANDIGLNRNTLARRISGASAFTINELDLIAAHIGVPIETLIATDVRQSA